MVSFHTPERSQLVRQPIAASSPTKYYPVAPDFTVKLTPTAKKVQDAVYKFRRKSDNASYVGMASLVQKRVTNHTYTFRHPEKDVGQSELAKAVRENPEDFEFGILVTKDDVADKSLSLGELEAIFIEFQRQKGPLFNTRKGGGGGSAAPQTRASTRSQKEVSELVAKLYTSPEKSYPLDTRTYKVLLTPSAKGDLYVIKRITEDASVKRYVGKTERPIRARMAEHSHYTRSKAKQLSQSELYTDMRTFPEQFEIKLLDSKQFNEQDIDMLERGLIEFFPKDELYNKNSGGGGGHVRRKLEF